MDISSYNIVNVEGYQLFTNNSSIVKELFVEWPVVVCKTMDSAHACWVIAPPESHLVVDSCVTLLEFIHPEYRSINESLINQVTIGLAQYIMPVGITAMYAGKQHSVAVCKVSVITENTNNDNKKIDPKILLTLPTPFLFKDRHIALFTDNAIHARLSIDKTHISLIHSDTEAAITEVARVTGSPVKHTRKIHVSCVHPDHTTRVVDTIEYQITGKVGTSYRELFMEDNCNDTIYTKAYQLCAHVEHIAGRPPLNDLNDATLKVLCVSFNGVIRKLQQLSGISFIGGLYVAQVQLCYLIEPLLCSSVSSVNSQINNNACYNVLLQPSTKKQRNELFHCIDYAKTHGNLTTMEYGCNRFYYPSSFIDNNDNNINNVIVSTDRRYVYSTDSENWMFTDYAGDLNMLLDHSQLNFTSAIKIYDDYKVLNSIDKLLPQTHARYLAEEEKSIIENITNISLESIVQTHNIPISIKMDYPIEEIAGFGHRCGWYYVIKNLLAASVEPNAPEILLIDFVEKTFSWGRTNDLGIKKHIWYNNTDYYVTSSELRYYSKNGVKTTVACIGKDVIVEWDGDWMLCGVASTEAEMYTNTELLQRILHEPWIGIWHNPHNMPKWFNYHDSPQEVLKLPNFTKSLKNCHGLIVLSEYFAEWVRQNLPGIPVSVMFHPTDKPAKCFTMNAYRDNKERSIVQVGYWLRNMCSLARLHAPNHIKIWLYGGRTALDMENVECKIHVAAGEACASMRDVHILRLPDLMYDEVLACNPALIWLYDSSANNGIIECIARSTPLLINKHPAAVEYLGDAYPGYCATIEEASVKLNDDSIIEKIHLYLRDTPEVQNRIRMDRFLRDFALSDVVQNVTASGLLPPLV